MLSVSPDGAMHVQLKFIPVLISVTMQTVVCRRQIQLQSAGALGARQAFRNIIQRDGVPGLYKGFLPNALKNLPNKGTLVFA